MAEGGRDAKALSTGANTVAEVADSSTFSIASPAGVPSARSNVENDGTPFITTLSRSASGVVVVVVVVELIVDVVVEIVVSTVVGDEFGSTGATASTPVIR